MANLTAKVTEQQPSRNINSGPISYSDFLYLGAFRVPNDNGKADSPNTFYIGGHCLAVDPSGNNSNGSLYMTGISYLMGGFRVAQISIPTPSLSRTITELPYASLLTGFSDVTNGAMVSVFGGNSTLRGLVVSGGLLYWAISGLYNTGGVDFRGIGRCALNLTAGTGQWGLSGIVNQMYGGALVEIPAASASNLGLEAATYIGAGLSTQQGTGTTSHGRSCFAFRPDSLGSPNSDVSATGLCYYPAGYTTEIVHTEPFYGVTKAMIAESNPSDNWKSYINTWHWNPATFETGAAWITTSDGRSALLSCGGYSYDPIWYGPPYDHVGIGGTPIPGRPAGYYSNGDKGYHGEPVTPSITIVDNTQLKEVVAGNRLPWNVEPTTLVFPPEAFISPCADGGFGGMSFDSVRRRLYITELGADRTVPEIRPVVHVWEIS